MYTPAFHASRSHRGAPPDVVAETLETERLVLRRPVEADIVAIVAQADNSHIASKLWDMPHPYTIADAGRFVRRLRERRNDVTGYAIIDQISHALVGCAKIEARETDHEAHIGFWIGEDHWNQGFATEAVQILVDDAFAACPRLTAIRAKLPLAHPAARRVLEKCGFQYAGPGTERSIRHRGLVPVDHYRLDRGIWSAIKAWASANPASTRRFG
jgi:RimJ/RimL family protein N-acetyltransferase